MASNPKHYNEDQMKLILLGALESSAKIYRTSIVVVTKNESLKHGLKQAYGGSIYPGRWILSSRTRRLDLLRGWAGRSPWRTDEIREEQVRLMEEAAGISGDTDV